MCKMKTLHSYQVTGQIESQKQLFKITQTVIYSCYTKENTESENVSSKGC